MYKIAVIGLGYVGLPLALEFSKKYETFGFDIDSKRISQITRGIDTTLEVSKEDIFQANNLIFTNNIKEISKCNIFIITVPTPVDDFKKPNLKPLLNACDQVGKILSKDDIVIFESTVYPGCTEEDCVPVLETSSGLKFNDDFFCGYSPERINPGDKVNTLSKIVKVTSGSNQKTAKIVDDLYKSIIQAGTYLAPSIKIAEASKAIENAQRDLNISFVNELSIIFDKIGIDTNDVLDAAATKWNFLKYKPGLVGGHCIGVDPYYLTYKSETLGYSPQVILSGRRVNDNMGKFISNKVIKMMTSREINIKNSNALVLGITFKENCPDIRNSKVIDIYKELKLFGVNVDVFDNYADKNNVEKVFNIKLVTNLKTYDVIILAVAHNDFLKLDWNKLKKSDKSIIFDSKSCLDRDIVDARL
tara:strand:- start:2845 stop:4095 length:1251 start_codon:yes stop_codon:yes gene_type:complete